jgi:hypothetical protein
MKSRFPTAMPSTYGPRGSRVRLHAGSAVGLAFQDIRDQLRADMGASQPGDLSTAQEVLIERGIWLHFHARRMELDAVDGKPLEVTAYVSLVNALANVLGKLGLERRAQRVPSLAEYLAARESTPQPSAASAPTDGPPEPRAANSEPPSSPEGA